MKAVKEKALVALTGNDAVAEAMRQVNPDVVAAYPITPQTELMHKFADYVADGDFQAYDTVVEGLQHSLHHLAILDRLPEHNLRLAAQEPHIVLRTRQLAFQTR